MQKIYLSLFLSLIAISLFGQEKNDYFVLNNGDTVFCKIEKINTTTSSFLSKPKNTIVYKISGEKLTLKLSELKGLKWEKQEFRNKKIFFNGKDSIYLFFPTRTGIYNYAGLVINKKKLTFYRIYTTSYDRRMAYASFFIEKNSDGILTELPVAQVWVNKNQPQTWDILKEYCGDNSYFKERMTRFIEIKERCNIDNLQDAICSYCEILLSQIPQYGYK